ncbi:MAG TPA: 3D domain-containing protein [Solirubrobacteraceae bacterium]|nr:3D domain-containing protein [Solirubrobacteraceae bacterium]
MSTGPRTLSRGALAALVTAAAATLTAAPVAARTLDAPGSPGGGAGISPPPSSGNGGANSGGAPIGGLAPTQKPNRKPPAPPSKRDHGSWLRGVTITEYWPAPESWFVGRLVSAPGLSGTHRIDWLYSAMGVSMEGEGIGLDGRMYHIDALGNGGWITATGAITSPSDGWSSGPPYWRQGGYWRNRKGGVTFPLEQGGWSAGPGRKYVRLRGVTFAAGASQPLRFYESIAVDPSVIPLGSRVYIPAYKNDGYGGWFVAQDTGGAIAGNHIDVYRNPPASPNQSGRYLTAQRAYVIKPHR